METPAVASSRQRIALFGLFGCGNLGNDGSLEAMIQFLRKERPDADIVSICDNPEHVAASQNVAVLPLSWSRHLRGGARKINRLFLKLPGSLIDLMITIRHLRDVDSMIIPGTGILDDFGERPYGMPLDIFRWLVVARLMGVRTALVSIGAGPIRHPVSRWLMSRAAGFADFRSYRDALSKNYMTGIGFDTSSDAIYPDIAFKLETPDIAQDTFTRNGRPVIGVGVMSYYGWYGFAEGAQAIYDAYAAKLSQFVIHLLDNGHDVRLLTGEIGDMTAVRDILEKVKRSRPDYLQSRIVAEPSHSLTELMQQMAETEIVVTTRFHNIVCALKMGKPTISLGYSRKNDVLMDEMGLGEFCQPIEQFDLNTLIGHFDTLSSHRREHELKIRRQVEVFRERLEEQDEILLANFI
ncbi:MAG: polysaccharide pyruvyl transferase family protein [Phyllobacterium sp.]